MLNGPGSSSPYFASCPHKAAIAEVDFFDQDFIQNPFSAYTELQSNTPVAFHEQTGLWIVSRYHDVLKVLADHETFAPDNVLTAVTRLTWDTLRVLAAGRFHLPASLANNGTETHANLRRLVSGFFTGDSIVATQPMVEDLTRGRLALVRAELDSGRTVDLGRTIASQIPCQVMLQTLGMTDIEGDTLASWTQAALELFWGNPDAERQLLLAADAVALYSWLRGHVRATAPDGDGFVAALRRHRTPEGRPLTDAQVIAVCYFIVIAGQVTTSQLLSMMFARMLAEGDTWQRVAADPELVGPWMEETLRREPPLTTWRRITTRATSINGVELSAKAPVLLMLAGSGSDPAVFAEPDRIIPGRPGARRHLAFGAGRHRCLGAEFSRMETRTILTMTARALPDLRLRPGPLNNYKPLLSFRSPPHVLVERTGGY